MTGEPSGDIPIPQPAEVKRPENNPVAQKLGKVANELKSPGNSRIINNYASLFENLRLELDGPTSQNVSELILEGVIGNLRRSVNPTGEQPTRELEDRTKAVSKAMIDEWFKRGLINRDSVAAFEKAYVNG